MLNIKLSDITEVGSQYTKNLPLAIALAVLFTYEFFTIIPFSFSDVSIVSIFFNILNNLNALLLSSDISTPNIVYSAVNPILADTTFTNFLQIQAIGQNLYTMSAVWLIITSVLLLLAMVAPIFLSKEKPHNVIGNKNFNNINNNKFNNPLVGWEGAVGGGSPAHCLTHPYNY